MTVESRSEIQAEVLAPEQLRALIEELGEEILGVGAFDELVRRWREHSIPDDAGATHLTSLLELAAA
jgi:hypothetical protein